MISDIGLVALSIAFLFSVYGTIGSAYGGLRNRPAWVESSRNASLLVFPLLSVSVLVVVYNALIGNDDRVECIHDERMKNCKPKNEIPDA